MQTGRLCKYCYHTLFVLSFLLSSTSIGLAQSIENLRLEQVGDKIVIYFDFSSANADNVYQLKVYQSINNYSRPISLVKGDVGEQIRPGKNKSIEWYAREELGAFKGELRIEIRIFQTPESIYVLRPTAKDKIKRGSPLEIGWTGGINEDEVSIQLMQNGVRAEVIASNVDNNGSYRWTTPSKIKPGKDYSILITGSSTSDNQGSGSPFTIARKVPLWVLVAPVAIVGGVVAVVLSSEKPPDDNMLPAAPDPN